MSILVPIGLPFGLHVVYVVPSQVSAEPTGLEAAEVVVNGVAEPQQVTESAQVVEHGVVEVTISNPDVAVVEQHPDHTDDPCWVRITAVTNDRFVVGVFDDMHRNSLPEMEGVEDGDPLPDMEIFL